MIVVELEGISTRGKYTFSVIDNHKHMGPDYARLASDTTPANRQALIAALKRRIQPIGAPNKLSNALRAFTQPLISP
jgi:hypothetical protein